MEQFKSQLKYIYKPLLTIILLSIFFISILFFGISQINSLNTKIADGKKEEINLSKKSAVLKEVENNLSNDMNFINLTIPSKNALVFAVSQIKSQSVKNNIIIGNIVTLKQVSLENKIVKNPIEVELSGSMADIYNLLRSFDKTLPIMLVESVRLDPSQSSSVFVTFNVFSTELPKSIPAVSGMINELDNSEIELLDNLSKYLKPDFFEPKPQKNNDTRSDPFN